MEFESEFEHKGHKVYKNTFLQKAYMRIVYDKGDWGRESFLDNLRPFAKEHFNVDVVDYNKDKDMKFIAPGIETEFLFSYDYAKVNIGRKGYKSFDETMKGHVSTIQSFVGTVLKEDAIKEMVIGKVNAWKIEIKDRNPDISIPINFIFKEKYADRIKRDGEDVIKGTVKIKSPMKTEGANLFLEFGFDYSECPKLALTLNLQVRYFPQDRIKTGDMLNIAEEINNVVYDAYFGIVTDNVIKVMDEEV